MKQWIVFIVFLGFINVANSQRLFSTKTGQITFESKAPLEDIEARNNEVESKLLSANGQIVFTLLMKGFQFENQLMEDHFNENYVESDKFPKATFTGVITNIKEINFKKNGVYPAKASGSLTIHGITQQIASDGEVTIKDGKVSIVDTFNIKLKDYNIGGNLIGKKIAESVTIKVNCQYQ